MSQELKKQSIGGYTLIEIIVSILFLSAIVMSLGHTFISSIDLTSNDQEIITANSLAKDYFREVETDWQSQNDFVTGTLPTVSSTYTKDNRYTVTATKEDVATDADDNVIVRRVNVVYKNQKAKTLVNLSLDFAKPGTQVTQ